MRTVLAFLLLCTTLSAERVIDFANTSAFVLSRTGIAAYWKMGEASGNLADSGPNGCTMTPTSLAYGASGALIGETDTAVTLDGTASTAVVSGCAHTVFPNSIGTAFSAFGWVNLSASFPATCATGVGYSILGKYTDDSARTGWSASIVCNSNIPEFCLSFSNNGAASRLRQCGTFSISKGEWTLVGFSYDGSATLAGIKLYVGGIRSPVDVGLQSNSLGVLSTTNTVEPLLSDPTAVAWARFPGSLQHWFVRTGETSAKEVQMLFLRGIISPTQPVRHVITDTDLGTDTDDLNGRQMEQHLVKSGYYDVLGYVSGISIDAAPACLDLVMAKGGLGGKVAGAYQPNNSRTSATFPYCTTTNNVVSTLTTATTTRASYPSGSDGLRKLLAAQPDGNVTLNLVGFGQNLRDLMQSSADSISPLTGMQLITAKVARIVWQAGVWPGPGTNDNDLCLGAANTNPCTAATYVFANWPSSVPFILVGVDNWSSNSIGSSGSYTASLPSNNPVLIGVTSVSQFSRPMWDVGSTFAVLDETLYYTTGGSNGTATVVSSTATATWAATPNANQSYYLRNTALISAARFQLLGSFFILNDNTPF